MARLIDADALIQNHCGECGNKEFCAEESCPYYEIRRRIENAPTVEPEVLSIPKEVSATDIDKLTEMIKGSLLQAYPNDAMFTAIRHGRWDEIGGYEPENHGFVCSVCDFATTDKSRFCPNCGARMDGGAENETC